MLPVEKNDRPDVVLTRCCAASAIMSIALGFAVLFGGYSQNTLLIKLSAASSTSQKSKAGASSSTKSRHNVAGALGRIIEDLK